MPSHRTADSRQPFHMPRGPGRLLAVGLLMMALATGCGPVSEEEEDSQPQDAVDTAAPQPAPEEEGDVSAMEACCFVRCSDGIWRGPFRSVVYNNCANYGKFYCGQHGMAYSSSKWATC